MNAHVKHPHQRALLPMAGLMGLALLTTLATWGLSIAGYAETALIWMGVVFIAIFGLVFLIVWILGVNQMRRARAFLESERVLVYWTYSPAEWQEIKDALWQEEKDDWKIQLGCLTFLFALAGLLTGVMLGWPEGLLATIANGLVGLLLGGLAGGAMGVAVASGNHWGARQAHSNPRPGTVALGVDEIFASDDYFKGDGVSGYICAAKLQRGSPSTLELQLVVPPRPRMPTKEQWIIPVPTKWVERVEEILPALAAHQEQQAIE